MFTINAGKDNIPFALVKSDSKNTNGEIIYINTDTKKKSTLKEKPITNASIDDGEFELLPSDDVRVIFIAGPSGSGKSHFAAQYIRKYKKLYKKAEFHLFSKLDEDKVLDKLEPHRITIDQSLVDDPIDLSEVPDHSIILFDDIDTISDKKLQDAINNIKAQILEMGRHRDIKCLITSHLISGNAKKDARIILNEMQMLVIFPQSGSAYQINYTLKTYFGLSSTQIKHIMNIESRWIAIRKIFPQALLSEHEAVFLNMLGK